MNGEYLLALRGYSPFNSTTSYSFSLVTPDLITQPLVIGEVAAGAIAEKGEQDSYTFKGVAGQQLFFDGLSNRGSDICIYIYDPAGQQVFSGFHSSDAGPNLSGLTLTTNGDYRLIVDGNGEATGDYGFRLFDKAAAPEVNLDEDITGTFDYGGLGSATYQFRLAAGQYLYIDGQQGTGAWEIYAPNGQYINSNNLANDHEFYLAAGAYLLIARGYGGGELNYKLRLVTPEFTTTTLAIGEMVSGSIIEKGEQDTYTFEGSAGQRLLYDALISTNTLDVRIYDPTGRQILSAYSASDENSGDGLTLRMNGLYRVIIDGSGANTGDYRFRLLDQASLPQVNLDEVITGTFDYGGFGNAAYRFHLVEGQYIYVDGIQGSGSYQIYRASGQSVSSSFIRNDQELWLKAGAYLIVLQGDSSSNLEYKLQIITPDLTTLPLVLGSEINGSIQEKGERDTYTFEGTAG